MEFANFDDGIRTACHGSLMRVNSNFFKGKRWPGQNIRDVDC